MLRRRRMRTGWPLAIALVWAAPTAAERMKTPPGAVLVLNIDYENGAVDDLRQGVAASPPPATDAIRLDCTHGRSGGCALASRLLADSAYMSHGALRAESSSMASLPVRYSAGDVFMYRFSLMFSSDWDNRVPESGKPRVADIVWQFKRFKGPPDMFIAAKGGGLVLRVGPKAQYNLIPAPLPLGCWIDIDIKVHWAADKRGEVEVWSSIKSTATSRVRHRGPNMRNAAGSSGYLKWGLYKPDDNSNFKPREVWHDMIEVYRLRSPKATLKEKLQ